MRAVISPLLCLTAVLAVGCNAELDSRCMNVCEQANACDVSQRAIDVDCAEYCQDVKSFNERAGAGSCDAQFQAHLECWQQNTAQICSKDFTGCQSSADAWTACMDAYCASAPESDPNCYEGGYALLPF